MVDVEVTDTKVFLPVVVGVWILLAAVLEFAFFEGDIFRAVIQGTVGGGAFALVYLVVRRRKNV